MKRLAVIAAALMLMLTGCARADYTGVILAMAIDGEEYTFAVSSAEGCEFIAVRGETAEQALEEAALASPRRPVYGRTVLILVGSDGAAMLPKGDVGATVAGVDGSAANALEGDVLRLKRLVSAAAKDEDITETSLAYVNNCIAAGRGAEVPLLREGAVAGMALLTKDGLISGEVLP